MRTELLRPIAYGEQTLVNKVIWGENRMVATRDVEDPMAKRHIALRRGPLMLAEDERLGYSTDTPVSVETDGEGYVDLLPAESAAYPNMLTVSLPLADGGAITLTDYASAGKDWNNGKRIAVWLLTD